MTAGRWSFRVAGGLLLGVTAAGVLTARITADGEAALAASEFAFDQGDVREATLHARTAAIHYVPGAPHVQAAHERLIAIAIGAEAAGDPAAAIAAWGAVRAAGLETRHWVSSHQAEVERANRELARLQALSGEDATGARGAVDDGMARRQREFSVALEAACAPRRGGLLLLAAGFLLAAAGLATLLLGGLTGEGRFAPWGGRWGLALVAIGAACWTVAVLAA